MPLADAPAARYNVTALKSLDDFSEFLSCSDIGQVSIPARDADTRNWRLWKAALRLVNPCPQTPHREIGFLSETRFLAAQAEIYLPSLPWA